MMICSLFLGILCAVPQVGAALRFDADTDADAEIEDDDDRPRLFPRSRQTKSGQRNRGASRHCRLIVVRAFVVVIPPSFESELLVAFTETPPR
jgi:hypothetical protein